MALHAPQRLRSLLEGPALPPMPLMQQAWLL